MKSKPSNHLLISAVLLTAALALSACGGTSKSVMAVAETTAAAAGYSAPEAYLEEKGSADFDTAADAGAESEFPAENETGRLPQIQTGRKLIRTVWLDMETTDFDRSLQSVYEKISALDGYTEQSEVTGNRLNYAGEPILRHASMTVRIPVKHLDAFLQAARTSGNVVSHSESTEDVTLQYSDVESRKKSLEIEQERIWVLLEKAESLESVIALEDRLSEIRYELEALESRLRLYNNQVEYSTVHLTLQEADESRLTPSEPLTAAQRISRDFQNNLASMGQFLLNLLISILTLAPFWVPAALLIFLLIRLLKKKAGANRPLFRKKKKAAPPDGESNP